VLGPFRGAVEVTGMATGTRELGVLDPRSLGARADALLLTGGSAFGLAAADGVVTWLAEQGLGFATPAGPVPLVPGAVIYDLAEGVPRPDATMGRAAADAASDAPVAEGRVGAGAGATVGKLAGRERSSPGGLGSAGGRHGAYSVGALVVVNAIGNVLDREGRVVAGARADGGGWIDASRFIREGKAHPEARPGTNTTLAVVATDAPFSRGELARVVRVAATALPRRIDPVNTPFDGDTVFALTTARDVADMSAADSLAFGVALRDLLEEAITRAVTAGSREP
jgi:L-aminopeptidase/D-esterase-like protein